MNKLEYQPGVKGKAIQMDGPVAFVGTAENLRGREWSYELGYRGLTSATRAAREVDVDFFTDYATADALRRAADADVMGRTPGILVAQNEWKQRAYILSSSPNTIHFGRLNTTLNVALLDGAWWRLVSKSFMTANATATQYQSATGETVSTSGAANAPLHALTVYGKSVQDGTPTPDAPVDVQVVQGLNLIEVNGGAPLSTTFDGYYKDLTVNNGLLSSFHLEEGVTYTISMEITSNYEPFNASVGCGNGSYAKDISSKFSVRNGYISITFTPDATQLSSGNILALRVPRYGSSQTGVSFTVDKVQLEKGSTATPYIPYGSIGLKVGSTVTPINLNGNVLASLPDGTQDVLHVENGSAWIEKKVGVTVYSDANYKGSWGNATRRDIYTNITSTNTGALQTGRCLSNMFQRDYSADYCTFLQSDGGVAFKFLASTGITTAEQGRTLLADKTPTLYYPISPQTIDLGSIDLPIVQDGDAVRVIADVTPTITAEWQVTPGLDYPHDYEYDYSETNAGNALESSVLIPSSVHIVVYGPAVNPYVIVGGNTYQVNVTVPSGGYLTIDGRDKTIVLTLADGTTRNEFAAGVRGSGLGGGSYVFEPLQPGSQSVAWDGSFGFDFGWYEEEGEPPWSQS